MQKLKQPKAKLFYFLITLEKKKVITSEQKGFLKETFFSIEEIIKDNQKIMSCISLKQRELKKKFMEVLTEYKNKQQLEIKKSIQTECNNNTKKVEDSTNETTFDNKKQIKCKKDSIFSEKNINLESIQEEQIQKQEDQSKKTVSELSSPESKNSLKKRPNKFLDVPVHRQIQFYQVVAEKDTNNVKESKKSEQPLKFIDEQKINKEKPKFEKPPMVRMETVKLEQNIKNIGAFVDYMNYAERIEEKKTTLKSSKSKKK